ncbi:hypothetical protein ACFQ60_19315 [Streptomyces zhihengii]
MAASAQLLLDALSKQVPAQPQPPMTCPLALDAQPPLAYDVPLTSEPRSRTPPLTSEPRSPTSPPDQRADRPGHRGRLRLHGHVEGVRMGLARLAALHGVATTFSPSPGVTEVVPDDTVVAVLGALGVDASTPGAVRAALEAADRVRADRLLPPTAVLWQEPAGPRLPAALTALPAGTELRVTTEQGPELSPAAPWARAPRPRPGGRRCPTGSTGCAPRPPTGGPGRRR